MKAIEGLLLVLALLCGIVQCVSHAGRHEQMHRRSASNAVLQHIVPTSSSNTIALDSVESAPVVKYINVVELHDDVANAVKSSSSNTEKENQQPNPPTSFPEFDMTGKLEGDYDPFSQVRHLVDGVFQQHEQQLKATTSSSSALPSSSSHASSSFLEVQSVVRRRSTHHHHQQQQQSHTASTLSPPITTSSSHASSLPASYSSRPVLASTAVASSLPVRVQSATYLSHRLGSETVPEGYEVAEYVGGVSASMLEVSAKVTKVHSFCEICILVMQMKERGEPHLCAGLNANYYITCVEVLESILRADKALVYWLKEGCMHLDSEGPEIVRPCPAINICSWVPNLFTPPPTIVRDEVESLCPKDLRFLPTIPEEYRALLGA